MGRVRRKKARPVDEETRIAGVAGARPDRGAGTAAGGAAARLRAWARRLKGQLFTLYLAVRRTDTPWFAKAFAAAVVAYAFSPIDLIPDFIPVLGYLDDVLLVPLGVWVAVRLVPGRILDECRAEAERRLASGSRKPVSAAGAAVIVLLWLLCGAAAARLWLAP
ncbi:YkvA family protein [Paenibacillus sp.]|uniref:YkvA family protein n=1 Tax=Paenibacillus sp. TaxID=58172 RepID=UPI002D501F39|nr:DUF1232 domain-containing protein [Paenibacillus sp.]HZG85743.1 DUF1232 domain-containing protein [Paenibacillus sp.]